eukprot:TRINITY_DN18055_c0_g1_i1.p1 TRINITY_DN18055_c0_g1~~TRINITY_DN18055_c0_g1_i1.p1  ORF type:complete len:117 (+),score=40.28 TRINITY_DN18055_c0_g1_i1:328-678(+)
MGANFDVQYASTQLHGAICEASFVRWWGSAIGPDVLLFSNPFSDPPDYARVNMTVQYSVDSGATWQPLIQVDQGPSAYSSLAPISATTFGLLWESGQKTAYEMIAFAGITASSNNQ